MVVWALGGNARLMHRTANRRLIVSIHMYANAPRKCVENCGE